MADLLAGVYRHYKGPLYLVLGLAHDANADTFWSDPWPKDFVGGSELLFPEGRTAVVYIGLQLDGAHLGPRLAVRTLEDFNLLVCTNITHSHYGEQPRWPDTCRPHPRFEYLGPELTKEMADADQ